MATTQHHSSVATQSQDTRQDARQDASHATDPAMSAAAELQRLELMRQMPAAQFGAMVCRLEGSAQWEIADQFERMGDRNRALIAIAAATFVEDEDLAAALRRQIWALSEAELALCLAVDEQPNAVTLSFTLPGETAPSRSYRARGRADGYEIGSYNGFAPEDQQPADETDEPSEQPLQADPAWLDPVTGDETTWRVLGPGALAALALPRADDAALDARVAELVTAHPGEVQQILTIVRVRLGPRAVEAYHHIVDPERLQTPSKLHAICILTKRIAALDAVIAQESADADAAVAAGGAATNATPAAFGVLAAAHVERMDLEHSRDILATGKGRYEGSHQTERVYQTWTIKQRDGRAIDCTTYPLKVLADTWQAVGRPDLFIAVKNAMYQEWHDKTGAPKSKIPKITGHDMLVGLRKALGWQGFFIYPGEADSKEARRKSWFRVPLNPELALTDFSSDSMQLKRARELPFAVLTENGHMGLLVYGTWYEVHWDYTHDSMKLIEATDLLNTFNVAAAMAPADDVARVLRAKPQD